VSAAIFTDSVQNNKLTVSREFQTGQKGSMSMTGLVSLTDTDDVHLEFTSDSGGTFTFDSLIVTVHRVA